MRNTTESMLDPGDAAYRCVLPAGEPWIREIRQDEVLRIVDLEGNQTADALFYNAHDYRDSYSAQDTIRAQRNIYPTTGTLSDVGRESRSAHHRCRYLRAARHPGRRMCH